MGKKGKGNLLGQKVGDKKDNMQVLEGDQVKKDMPQVSEADGIFQKRFERHHDELRWLYMELYGFDLFICFLCSCYFGFEFQRLSCLHSLLPEYGYLLYHTFMDLIL